VETYDIAAGNNRIPEILAVPYLDVVAALSENRDRLTLFCVNRDERRDREAKIRVAGFRAAARAQIETLAGDSIHQANDEMRPEAVRPVESSAAAGSAFEYTFPRGSVTVMVLRAAAGL
jgi:alpha-L-arabinofuranosidase